MLTNTQLVKKIFSEKEKVLHKYRLLTVLFKEWSGIDKFDKKMNYWKTAFMYWDPAIVRSGSGPSFKFPYGRGIPGFMKVLQQCVFEIENDGKDVKDIDKNIRAYLQKTWDEIKKDKQYKNAFDDYMKEKWN